MISILALSRAFYQGGRYSRLITPSLRPTSPGIGLETPGEIEESPGVRRDVSFSSIRWVPTPRRSLTAKEQLTEKMKVEYYRHHYWTGPTTGHDFNQKINYDMRYKIAAGYMLALGPGRYAKFFRGLSRISLLKSTSD